MNQDRDCEEGEKKWSGALLAGLRGEPGFDGFDGFDGLDGGWRVAGGGWRGDRSEAVEDRSGPEAAVLRWQGVSWEVGRYNRLTEIYQRKVCVVR